jgi:hypothetical protein
MSFYTNHNSAKKLRLFIMAGRSIMRAMSPARSSARRSNKKVSEPCARAAGEKDNRGFDQVFAALRGLLTPYEGNLAGNFRDENYYYLESLTPTYKNRRTFFAAVSSGKNYVSFHLMPVYGDPHLRETISPELKKHMQGKACFNFKTVDEESFRELARLTAAGYETFRKLKYL